jgi:peptidylprolyl isomerase
LQRNLLSDREDNVDKPEIEFFDPEPPTDLVVTDLTAGDGAEATAGSTVEVHYVGVAHSTGEEFDASYNRGQPLSFRLGVGQVISGWDQGVTGMKVGGRRQLVIPPHLGYGDRGAGGAIGPGETLIFVVDLLGVA